MQRSAPQYQHPLPSRLPVAFGGVPRDALASAEWTPEELRREFKNARGVAQALWEELSTIDKRLQSEANQAKEERDAAVDQLLMARDELQKAEAAIADLNEELCTNGNGQRDFIVHITMNKELRDQLQANGEKHAVAMAQQKKEHAVEVGEYVARAAVARANNSCLHMENHLLRTENADYKIKMAQVQAALRQAAAGFQGSEEDKRWFRWLDRKEARTPSCEKCPCFGGTCDCPCHAPEKRSEKEPKPNDPNKDTATNPPTPQGPKPAAGGGPAPTAAPSTLARIITGISKAFQGKSASKGTGMDQEEDEESGQRRSDRQALVEYIMCDLEVLYQQTLPPSVSATPLASPTPPGTSQARNSPVAPSATLLASTPEGPPPPGTPLAPSLSATPSVTIPWDQVPTRPTPIMGDRRYTPKEDRRGYSITPQQPRQRPDWQTPQSIHPTSLFLEFDEIHKGSRAEGEGEAGSSTAPETLPIPNDPCPPGPASFPLGAPLTSSFPATTPPSTREDLELQLKKAKAEMEQLIRNKSYHRGQMKNSTLSAEKRANSQAKYHTFASSAAGQNVLISQIKEQLGKK